MDVSGFGSKSVARAYVPIPDAFWAAVNAHQLDRASAIIQPFIGRQESAFGLICSLRLPEDRRKHLLGSSASTSLQVYGTLRHVNIAARAIDVDPLWLGNIVGI